jgi:L-aminopeptidase/D-esterase-like protein
MGPERAMNTRPSAPRAARLPLGSLRRGRGVLEVPGVAVGHCDRTEDGSLTGATVIVPPAGTMAGVDVRGGGPAGHETAILEPGTLTYGADAIVLTGGSALGLVSAHGVKHGMLADGRGFPAPGLPGVTVPIVPAAGIFDLGRGGEPAAPPTADDGLSAYRDAGVEQTRIRGSAGAGQGAWTGRGLVRGGLGSAIVTTPSGFTVAAIVVANPMGSVLDREGRLYSDSVLAGYGIRLPTAAGIADRWAESDLAAPNRPESAGAGAAGAGERNTTIACVVTDARLDSAMTTRLAQSAHSGLARAIYPSHTMFDGDTVFALATAAHPLGEDIGAQLVELNIAAADALSAAIVDAVLTAETYDDPSRLTSGGQPVPPPLSDVAPELTDAWRALA